VPFGNGEAANRPRGIPHGPVNLYQLSPSLSMVVLSTLNRNVFSLDYLFESFIFPLIFACNIRMCAFEFIDDLNYPFRIVIILS
jgi:hypothetical protein